MSIDISAGERILKHGLQDLANLSQQDFMSTDQLTRDLNTQAARGLFARLSVTEIARLRAKELAAVPKSEIFLDHDTRRVHAAIGIKNALVARDFLLGTSEQGSFHTQFISRHPYHPETQAYHSVQLAAFEKLLRDAFSKQINFDEATGIYSPVAADSGHEIVRSTITLPGESEPNVVRFVDAHKHALLTSAAGQYALNLIAGA